MCFSCKRAPDNLETASTILISIPVFIYAGKMLYDLKPVSADGRFYIWQISLRMLSENPWFGIGIDKFKSKYMYYQADYFSGSPESPFTQIADNINAPFSEPLKIMIEQGIIGIIIFSVVILSALMPIRTKKPFEHIKNKNSQAYYLYVAILIALLLFSCFSYLSIYIQFNFLLIVCLAVLSGLQPRLPFSFGNRATWRLSLVIYVFVASCILFGGIRYAVYMKKFQHHTTRFSMNNPENSLPFLTSLESVLKSNSGYLASCFNLLSFNKEYASAIAKLNESQSYRASYSYCMELGRNYELMGDTVRALEYWELSSRMVPNRFEPLYLQIRSYHQNKQYSMADSLTALFLQKKRKVDVISIDVMIRDVRRWEKERVKELTP